MPFAELHALAIALAIFGLLMGLGALVSRASGRVGIPVALLFLAAGMAAAGVEGLGGIHVHSYALAFRWGTVALVLILFDGGLNTSLGSLRQWVRPAAVLATVGVAGTAVLTAACARAFGFSLGQALLLGAVVSSTDAAAVFGVLRGSRIQLRRRLALTLELESGLNDPVAVILTLALTRHLAEGTGMGWRIAWQIPLQLAVGAGVGWAMGRGGKLLLQRIRLPAAGLYPVFTLAVAFLGYGGATLLRGSGFLAVYVAAVGLGNASIPYRMGLLRVHDALAWLAQVSMFLVLGLLAVPGELLRVAGAGLGIGLFVTAIARPLAVLLCLLPFGYPLLEMGYVGWVGLRGAVPIILATIPVLAGTDGAFHIFNVVFFVVVLNALVPGGTVRWATRWLGLEERGPPQPEAVLEIHSTRVLAGEVMSFYIGAASAVSGAALSELPFPKGSAAMLVVRGKELIAPRGEAVLRAGDHVYVFCRPEDRPFVQLLFGQREA